MSRFPGSTDLVVGPGFKDAFGEGWPKVEGSGVRGDDWEGRELREVAFDDGLKIGRLRAVDWFGDGSFYLLDTPGHAVGHVCGLARVKEGEGEAFVFMGGVSGSGCCLLSIHFSFLPCSHVTLCAGSYVLRFDGVC